jgi:hypothetical protein
MSKLTLSASILLFLVSCLSWNMLSNKEGNKQELFNGKDFTGWVKYIGVPHKSLQLSLPKDSLGNYKTPIGNDDFLKVFSVVREDGEPAIFVNGKVFGTITSEATYENYHITLQYKWGEKKFAPRLQLPRDAGLLYHAGDKPMQNRVWPLAQECQIQQGDCGDYWKIDKSMAHIPAVYKDSNWIYSVNADYVWFGNEVKRPRCMKSPDNEKPQGEWNTVEVYTSGDSSVHVVNGLIVMHLKDLSVSDNGTKKPLIKGRIVLQSEGAELYYRRIILEPIKQLPESLQRLYK